MADVIMPQMGESIAEGTVTKWLKNVGDKVERDEPLFEISTDKVDAEIPSPAAGILKEIRVAPGTTVPIHTVVGVIAAEGEAVATAPAPTAPGPLNPPPLPSSAPHAPSTAGVITLPPVPPPAPPAPPPAPAAPPAPPPPPAASAPPAAHAPLAMPPPAPPVKAATPPPQPAPPPVVYHLEGEPPAAAAEKPRAEMTAEELRQTRSSPVVRKIAAEHQLDIREVPGTGIGGRVTKQDILGHIEGRSTPAAAPAPTAAPTSPAAPAAPGTPNAPAPVAGPRVQIVPMSPIRKKTAEHMVLSKRISAHVSTVFEIDFTRIDHLRHKHKASFEERGVRLTYVPFVLKAVVDALAAFPVLNASIDGDNVVYRKDVNLGVAVALDWGLIVPVIHHADEKNVLGLARAVNDIAERARAKKLKVEEVQGGTFTVTNPGVFGSLFGTPIINQPQVAILGLGTIEKRPVVRDDAIAIRTMAYVALTFDHRLVDGADADRFMAQIKKTLQEFDESSL
jgi:2-oxoglutarate dehydrogenase E2 component (dihydrolipoamide succinyltransferase)